MFRIPIKPMIFVLSMVPVVATHGANSSNAKKFNLAIAAMAASLSPLPDGPKQHPGPGWLYGSTMDDLRRSITELGNKKPGEVEWAILNLPLDVESRIKVQFDLYEALAKDYLALENRAAKGERIELKDLPADYKVRRALTTVLLSVHWTLENLAGLMRVMTQPLSYYNRDHLSLQVISKEQITSAGLRDYVKSSAFAQSMLEEMIKKIFQAEELMYQDISEFVARAISVSAENAPSLENEFKALVQRNYEVSHALRYIRYHFVHAGMPAIGQLAKERLRSDEEFLVLVQHLGSGLKTSFKIADSFKPGAIRSDWMYPPEWILLDPIDEMVKLTADGNVFTGHELPGELRRDLSLALTTFKTVAAIQYIFVVGSVISRAQKPTWGSAISQTLQPLMTRQALGSMVPLSRNSNLPSKKMDKSDLEAQLWRAFYEAAGLSPSDIGKISLSCVDYFKPLTQLSKP